jgi:hypothetical protein
MDVIVLIAWFNSSGDVNIPIGLITMSADK